jgi:hypothetical protein
MASVVDLPERNMEHTCWETGVYFSILKKKKEKLHQMTHRAIDTLSRYLAFFKIRFLLNLQKGNKSMGFN